MSQISFFARFPDVDSKIRETTVMRITISPHVLHHHFVLTPWRSSNDPRAEYGTILYYRTVDRTIPASSTHYRVKILARIL